MEKLEIILNDCSLEEVKYDFEYFQNQGKEVYFKGRGNGEVVLVVGEKQSK
jgi:hypothetical protein